MNETTFNSLQIDRPAPRVARLTLHRPPVNALGRELVAELEQAARELGEEPGLCAVLLAARGKAFCAGADLKERRGMDEAEVEKTVAAIGAALAAVAAIPVPTLALIQGAALGGGLELALACDLRFAATPARLGLPECSLAIIPGAGGTQRLARLAGPARAKRWVFGAELHDADEALADRVVDRVVPVSELDDAGLAWASSVARCGPVALRAAKRAIDEGLAAGGLADGLAVEREQYARVLGTWDRREALDAFREKRNPAFRGE